MLSDINPQFDKAIEHLAHECAALRSGRVSPALVDQVRIETYGSNMPLIELASINTPEPRLIVVQPWDPSIIKDIEKGILAANVGASPVIDGALIRLNFPSLTEERRKELVKQLGSKLEEARVAVRNIREEVLKKMKAAKAEGDISEDDFFGQQKDLQKIVDDYNAKIKKIGDDKEKDIMTV